MITKFGVVVVTQDDVTVNGFHFEETDYYSAQLEALNWAIHKLCAAQKEAASHTAADSERRSPASDGPTNAQDE